METINNNFNFLIKVEDGVIISSTPYVTLVNTQIRNMLTKIYITLPRDIIDNYKDVTMSCNVIHNIGLNRDIDLLPYTITQNNVIFELYDCNYDINHLKELKFTLTCREYIGVPDKTKRYNFYIQKFTATVARVVR